MIIVRIVLLIKCQFRNACILNHGNHGTIITIALAGPCSTIIAIALAGPCIGILNDFSSILNPDIKSYAICIATSSGP